MPQQTPMLIPPIVQQTTPDMPPPMVPQQIPVLAPPTPMPQQTPMLIPPIVQQTTPDMPPPMAPQQVPVAVPVPVVMNVPPAPGSPPSRRVTPNKPMPMTSVSYEPVPATPYVTPRPQPLGRTTAAGATSLPQLASGTAAPATTAVATSSVPVTKSKEPALVVTTEAATASQNEKLITVSPGRQAANNYPSFNVDSNTPNRTCVVSGFERRKTVGANGVETYQGTLPSFRMVVTEVADLPAWHPLDAGCVISVTHKR
jgi:hypothetical protein